MISKIQGLVLHKDLKNLVIDVGGVGYKIFCPSSVIEKAELNKNLSVWTHLAVREDVLDLYGFLDKEELDFFELLISSVSGVGPKSALGILNVASLSSLMRAISSGETTYLTKVSGIGRKTAEKIILELKDKVGHYTEDEKAVDGDGADAILALESLGYPEKLAREALNKVSKDSKNTADKIKKALKILNQ